jgi:hypothetical protein
MWKYIAAAFLFLIGAFEILLALNKSLREEVLKNSPLQLTSVTPVVLFLVGLSAFLMGLGILFYNRFF